MTLKRYLFLMILGTLFCWAAFFIVVNSVNPYATVALGFWLFYLSLFFALSGTFALAGFMWRNLVNKNQFISEQVWLSFRQGFLLALLLVLSLFLMSQDLLTWWNLLLLIAILLVVEFFFLAKTKNYGVKTNQSQKAEIPHSSNKEDLSE